MATITAGESLTVHIKTTKMQRTDYESGEVAFADVHPDEVQNWQAGGWQIVSPTAKPVQAEAEESDSKPSRKRNAKHD